MNTQLQLVFSFVTRHVAWATPVVYDISLTLYFSWACVSMQELLAFASFISYMDHLHNDALLLVVIQIGRTLEAKVLRVLCSGYSF